MFVREEDYNNLTFRIKKIISFLQNYWVVYFIFLMIGVIFKEPLPSAKLVIFQLFGVRTATGYDWKYFSTIHPVFAWYVSFYCLFLLVFPLLKKLAGRTFVIDNIVYFLVLNVLYILMKDYIWVNMPLEIDCILDRFTVWGGVGMVGYLFAKYNFFEKIDKKVKSVVKGIPLLMLCILIIGIMIVTRYKIGVTIVKDTLMSWDLVYTPILIYTFIVVLKSLNNKYLEKVLESLSYHSTNMWFLHGMFFTPMKKLQYIVYFPKNPLLILCLALLLMFTFSMILEKLKKILKKGKYFEEK